MDERSHVLYAATMHCSMRRVALASFFLVLACKNDDGGPAQDTEAADDDAADDDDAGTMADDDADSGSDSASEGETGLGGDGMTDFEWHRDIAPVVQQHCGGCHDGSGAAPFSVFTYPEASGWAVPMAFAVQSHVMPPFYASNTDDCEVRFPWLNDPRLDDDQIEMLVDWADGGAPEGDPSFATPPPELPPIDVVDPDRTVVMPSDVSIEGKYDSFICLSLDPELTEDVWMSEMQVVPGNTLIVHHALVYLDTTGESAEKGGDDGQYDCFGGIGLSTAAPLIAAWTPGAVPFKMPPEAAVNLPAGSRLVLNIHYHPSPLGVEVDDATAIDLKFFEGEPAWRAELQLEGNVTQPIVDGVGLEAGPNDLGMPPFFGIPAGVKDHTETMRVRLGPEFNGSRLWLAATHMHFLGISQRISIERAAPGDQPGDECLIESPHWDFNWQQLYMYDVPLAEAPTLAEGDILTLECSYDNTTDNPAVVAMMEEFELNAPIDVGLGEQTLDEMCLSFLGIAVPLVPEG
jgi:hypothetical protein